MDMLQVAWVAAALFSLLRAIEAKENGQRAWLWSIASLLCVAGGFLTKWTAPAFFYLAVVPFLWQRGRLRWLVGREHVIAACIAATVCCLWAVSVARDAGWQTLVDTVSQEAAQRLAPGTHGKRYPWVQSLTFPLVFLGANLPWSLPAVLALRPRFMGSLDDRERRLVQLLHCWAWPNLVFWSLPAQHHVRYVLPICPAVTILGVIGIQNWVIGVRPSHRKLLWGKAIFLGVLLAWAAVKVGYVESIVPARTANRNARLTGERIATLVPEGEILYLCRLKDEGVLFYYNRPARRFCWPDVPSDSRYLLLLDDEWATAGFRGDFVEVAELHDQQHAPIHLLRRAITREDCPQWQDHNAPIRPMSLPSPR